MRNQTTAQPHDERIINTPLDLKARKLKNLCFSQASASFKIALLAHIELFSEIPDKKIALVCISPLAYSHASCLLFNCNTT